MMACDWHPASIVIFGLIGVVMIYRDGYSVLRMIRPRYRKVWQEPGMPQLLRLKAHAPMRYHTNVEVARVFACQSDYHSRTDRVQLLDGREGWVFRLCGSVEEALGVLQRSVTTLREYRRVVSHNDMGFGEKEKSAGSDSSEENLQRSLTALDNGDWLGEEWVKTPVPSNWTMLDNVPDWPIYTNVAYPFPNRAPYAPAKNPTGIYKLKFNLKDELREHSVHDNRFTVIFHGFESCMMAYLNGHFIGMSKDSRLPAEFDVTSCLKTEGESLNTLEVIVIRFCDGSYLEDQDHWWMAGLHRSVELVCQPKELRVGNFKVDANQNGLLGVLVELEGTLPSIGKNYSVKCELYDDEQTNVIGGIRLGSQVWAKAVTRVVPTSTGINEVMIRGDVKDPKLWTSDTPNLYTLVIILFDGETEAGNRIQVESVRIGFRTACISHVDGMPTPSFTVNNQKVVVCGVNRHEHGAYLFDLFHDARILLT